MQRMIATLTLALSLGAAPPDERLETADAVRGVLEEVAQQVSGDGESWSAVYRRTRVLVHAVERHGRMRIMAPIVNARDLEAGELRILLEANYARALDAKFAIGDGVLWSLFNRPLAGMTRRTFTEGLEQVVTLKKNFGSTYRSTELTFGEPPPGGDERRP